MIEVFSKDGLEQIVKSNDFIELTILPKLGGKMISLKDKVTGTEFLLPNQHPSRKYFIPKYGDDFSLFDCSGWDECFPNISQEEMFSNNNKIILPDHGELWNREWKYFIDNNDLILRIDSIALNYELEKKITLRNNEVSIFYKLTNLSKDKFDYIWATHPLLNVEPGDKILFSDEIKELSLYWSSDEKDNKDDKINLPIHKSIDFSVVQNCNFKKALKLYSKKLTVGSIGLVKQKQRSSLTLEFDVEKFPFLGIWLCYCGWPTDREEKHFTIALEPTTSNTDSLSEAIRNQSAKTINPKEIIKWEIIIKII
ncbi:MAG: hypothetical protein JXA68_12180 [Ignavibacteriales bacterium]|nr:hypothetical protein [Ignavibacteriales bacterium]